MRSRPGSTHGLPGNPSTLIGTTRKLNLDTTLSTMGDSDEKFDSELAKVQNGVQLHNAALFLTEIRMVSGGLP